MAIQPILTLGDPGLWKKCEAVEDVQAPETADAIRDLKDTLEDFKNRNGFGRGIAAPQIGVPKRILFIDFPQEKMSRLMINPRIAWQSEAKIRLWDDCFSFPDLLVKVERARADQCAEFHEAEAAHGIAPVGLLVEAMRLFVQVARHQRGLDAQIHRAEQMGIETAEG